MCLDLSVIPAFKPHALLSVIMCLRRVLAKLQAATKKEKADQASEPSDGAPEAKKKPKKAKGEIEDKLLPEKVSCPNHMNLANADFPLSTLVHAGYGQSSRVDLCGSSRAVPAE